MKIAMQVTLLICFAMGCLADEPTQQGSSNGDGDSIGEATGTSADELTSSGATANQDDSKPMSAIADAVSMPHGCGRPVVSSDSHSLTALCSSGHGARYKVTADACSTSNCVKVGSDIVNYGTTAKVTGGGGYVTASSVTVYWYPASGSTACAYSKLGKTVSWCDMNQNIRDWAARHPSYDESGSTYISNWYKDKSYRPDCSGTVAMAWHMSTNTLNTDSLLSSAYTKPITPSQLKPGDILDYVKGDYNTHHVVIFAGWNSDHTSGTNGHFSVWTFGYGTFANDSGHHETNDSFSGDVAGHKATDYTPRRYVHAD
jgi:hypothetical protein